MYSCCPYTSDISIHTLRVEGDAYALPSLFPITCISIHTLRVEGDFKPFCNTTAYSLFQSTPSVWRVTLSR